MSGFGPPPGATEGETRTRPAAYLPPGGLARARGGAGAAYGRYAVPTFGKPGIIPLKPLGLGDLLDGAIKHVRRNAGPVLGLSCAVNVAAAVPVLLLVIALVAGSLLSATRLTRVIDAGLLTTLLSFGGSGLACLLLTGVLAPAVAEATLGRRLDAATVWAQVRPRIWAVIGSQLVVTAALLGPWLVLAVLLALLAQGSVPVLLLVGLLGGLAALLTGAWLTPRLIFSGPAIVLEGHGLRAGLRRAWLLSRRRYWAVVGVGLLALLIVTVVFWMVQLPQLLIFNLALDQLELAPQTRDEAGSFAFTLANLGAAALVTPGMAGLFVLLYLDARMRLEGFDLVLQRTATERAARR